MITESHFFGRGNPGNRNAEYLHMAEPGFVYCVSIKYGAHAFVWGYTRMFLMDEWGIQVSKVFRRCSSPAVTTSWTETVAEEAWIYRPAVVQLIQEQPWMSAGEN